MTDTVDVLMQIGLGIVVGLAMSWSRVLLDKPDCEHKWGDWERENDTEFAVVQSRLCCKCQMHQIHQVRKLGNIEGKT